MILSPSCDSMSETNYKNTLIVKTNNLEIRKKGDVYTYTHTSVSPTRWPDYDDWGQQEEGTLTHTYVHMGPQPPCRLKHWAPKLHNPHSSLFFLSIFIPQYFLLLFWCSLFFICAMTRIYLHVCKMHLEQAKI